MKVVVTGASGLLGRAVQAHFSSEQHQVLALANSRATPPLVQLDLLDTDALRKTIQDFKPDIIVHAAAERRPDVVEKEPERSQELNVDVPGRIAEICNDSGTGARLIYISTDYVFDGSKPPYKVDSETNPLNAYGTSKLLGERAVAEKGQQGHVTSLRVPVLYGPATHPSESAVNILQTTIVPPSDGRTIKMDAYAVRYPTNVQDVAKVIAQIAHQAVTRDKQLPPILHFQATEAMTKYDMCNVMSRLQNRNAPPLPETSVSHLDPEYEIDPMAATARPRHCKMDTSVLQEFGVDVSHVTFEEWWSEEMTRQAGQEEERQRKQQEEEQRRREEEEKKRQEEEERQRREAEEQQRREAEEKKRLEEQEETRRLEEEKRRQEEAERVQQQQEEEAARQKAEAEQLRLQAEQDEKQSRDAERSQEDQADQASAEQAGSARDAESPSAPSVPSTDSAQSTTAKPATTSPEPRAPTPSSPNPSFSSLRARPTPPGSSARSPTTSQPPSLRNAEGIVPPLDDQAPPPVPAKRPGGDVSRSSSRSRAGDSTVGTPQSSQTIRSNPFRTESPRPAALETGDTIKAVSRPKAGDDDEDPYGQPSPRPGGDEEQGATQKSKEGESSASAFKDGYGEVRFGIDDKAQDGDKDKPAPAESSQEPSQPSFVIKVGDPHKVGDAMTGHIVYTVRTQTRAAGFKASTSSSLRRYNDFRWLHAALVHNNPGIIIPPVPEKVRGLISRFSPDLVEARRHGLEICVNKIANHPVLAKDEDLKLFLESEDFSRDVKLRDARKGPVPTPEQKTWMGWSGTVGVNSGHKFVEYDEWFDQQKAYLDALEAQLKGMVKSINALSQSRKELADCIAASSHSLLMLSGSSLSRSLSACFAGLGDLQRRAQELEDIQSDSDVRHFGSVLYEYERVVGSVRKAFSTRIDCWHLTQKADDDLRRTRTKHEKLKREPAANHYYEESLKDLAEAEDRALERRAELDKVSRRCKEEMRRFDREKVDDLRRAMDRWLEGQIERREELLEEWIDYSQKCLSLDLRSEEEKVRDRERAARLAERERDQGQAESKAEDKAVSKADSKAEDKAECQLEDKNASSEDKSTTVTDTNGKVDETVPNVTDDTSPATAPTVSTNASVDNADGSPAAPASADKPQAEQATSAGAANEDKEPQVETTPGDDDAPATHAKSANGEGEDSSAPAENEGSAPLDAGGSLEEANVQDNTAAAQ